MPASILTTNHLTICRGFGHRPDRFALDMTASILAFQSVTWKPGIWEPVVGTTFRPQFNSKLRLFTQADFGWTGDSRRVGVKGSLEWEPDQVSAR